MSETSKPTGAQAEALVAVAVACIARSWEVFAEHGDVAPRHVVVPGRNAVGYSSDFQTLHLLGRKKPLVGDGRVVYNVAKVADEDDVLGILVFHYPVYSVEEADIVHRDFRHLRSLVALRVAKESFMVLLLTAKGIVHLKLFCITPFLPYRLQCRHFVKNGKLNAHLVV